VFNLLDDPALSDRGRNGRQCGLCVRGRYNNLCDRLANGHGAILGQVAMGQHIDSRILEQGLPQLAGALGCERLQRTELRFIRPIAFDQIGRQGPHKDFIRGVQRLITEVSNHVLTYQLKQLRINLWRGNRFGQQFGQFRCRLVIAFGDQRNTRQRSINIKREAS